MAKTNHKRLEELQVLSRLMSDPAGRRWAWGFLSGCSMWGDSFSTNALRLAYIEGGRNQGVHLWQDLREANEEMVFQMMREFGSERHGSGNGNGSSIDAARDYNPIAGDDGDASPEYNAE